MATNGLVGAAVAAATIEEVHRDDQRLPSGCPMAGLLEMLTRPWTLHILWLLSREGPMRFGALRRNVEGISARLLTVRLRTLEAEGFVRREQAVNGRIVEVTYTPTAKTAAMHEIMALLQRVSRMGPEGRVAASEAHM